MKRVAPPPGWRVARLADVAVVNPPRRPPQGSVTFVAMEDVDAWRRDVVRWSRREEATGSRFANGDSLLARITPCLEAGKTALVSFLDSGEVGCGSTEFLVFSARAGVSDAAWLYYTLRSQPFRAEAILSMTGTSGRQRVMRQAVEEFVCDVPPLAEQVRIGRVLAGIDDKIELNRRTSTVIEKLVRALFAEWFGGLDPATPSDGWTVARLGEHVDAVRGLSYTGAGLAEDGVPLHNLDSIGDEGGYRYDGLKHYRGEYRERHLVRAGDVIAVNTDLTWAFQRIAQPAIVPQRFRDRSLFSHHLYRVRLLSGSPLSHRFVYLALMSPRLRQAIVGYSNGTTVNMLPADAFQRPRLAIPPADLVAGFDDLVAPLFAKQEQLQLENETLARLRDLLLPKLLSGEIRTDPAAPAECPASVPA